MFSLACHAERDAFDTLFDHAPDKLNLVKKSLITFVNKHLNKLNLEVTDLETQVSRASVEGSPGLCFLQSSTPVGCGNKQDHLASLRRSFQSIAHHGIAPA